MKNTIIKVYVTLILLFPLSLWPVSLPEGIQGVTQTYGPWLENLLENSPLKKLFPDENVLNYREYQRLLLIAERQIENSNPKDALSNIRRAMFLLDDIIREVQLKYEWNSIEDRILTISTLPKDESIALATFLAQKSHLLLQYEYYYYNYDKDFSKSEKFFNEANDLLKLIPEESAVRQQLQKTALFSYINTLEKSYRFKTTDVDIYIQKIVSLLKKKTKKQKSVKGYWEQRIYKRAILFFSSTGNFNEAFSLLETMDKLDPEIIPESLRISILMNKGELPYVLERLVAQLNSLDLTKESQWGSYVVSANRYWNALMVQNDLEQLRTFTNEYIVQISYILNEYYLRADVFNFFQNEKFKFEMRLAFLNADYKKSINSDTHGILDTVIKKPSNPTPNSENIFNIYKSISGKPKIEKGTKPAVLYFFFRKAMQEKKWTEANKIRGLLKSSSTASSYKTSSELLYSVTSPDYRLSEKEWYSLWKYAVQDASFRSPESFLYTDAVMPTIDFSSLFADFISSKAKDFSVEFKIRLLRLIDFHKNWEERIKYPPAYFNAIDNRIRYDYLAKFEFSVPQNKKLNLIQPEFKILDDTCPEETVCWAIFPVKNDFYSLIWQNSKKPVSIYEGFTSENRDIVKLLDDFYKQIETGSEPEKVKVILRQLSFLFEKPMEVATQTAKKGDLPIKLYLFQNAHLMPFESFFLNNDTYLSQSFRITRKMPVDLLTYFNHCMEKCDEKIANKTKHHFFIGVGSRKGRFIFGSSETGDEIIEVENLFAEKALIFDGSNLGKEILAALQDPQNRIFHIAGEWSAQPTNPSLIIRGKEENFRLGQIQVKRPLPYVVVSMQRVNTFNKTNHIWLTDILETFRYHNTDILIISLAPTPKTFRQAFFYNMYYRLEQKGENWYNAFRYSLRRTQKGFTHHIWPFLMVFYEK